MVEIVIVFINNARHLQVSNYASENVNFPQDELSI